MITAQGDLELQLDRSPTAEELANLHDQVQRTIYRVLTRRLNTLAGVRVTGVVIMNLEEDEGT